MLQILCSSVSVKLLVRAKLRFLREQPDDCFFCGEPCYSVHVVAFALLIYQRIMLHHNLFLKL